MSAPKKHPLSALLAQLVGQTNVIVVHTHIIKLLDNDHLSALFFEQLCYWSERTSDPDKWVAKTDADWFDELYLGKKQLIRIRSVLCGRGLIETDVRRSMHYHGQPVLHYRVNLDGLELLLTGISRSAKRELPESDETALPESAKRVVSFTETLQETMTEKKPVAPKNGATARPSKLTNEQCERLQADGAAIAERVAAMERVSPDDFTSSADGMTPDDVRSQPFEMLKAAVMDVFSIDNAGLATNYAKMLSGRKAKDVWGEYRFSVPMDATELQDWALWYKRTYPTLSLAKSAEAVAKSVGEYRATGQKSTGVQNPIIPAAPALSEHDRAAQAEALRQHRQNRANSGDMANE